MRWVTLYDLRVDQESIARIQKATLTTREFGLKPERSLFGLADWWQAIEEGRLPVHVAEGTISEVYWGSMGDWPEFTLVTLSGERSSWARQGDHTRYVEGLRVRVTYVVQHFKDTAVPNAERSTQVVLQIDIEDSPRRSPAPAPGPFGRPHP